ncbi:MAG: NUDIX hydrolase [Xenococcaceae cyanobacterium]
MFKRPVPTLNFVTTRGNRVEKAKIATLYDNPVKDSNKIHLFLAEGVSLSSQQKLDVTEDIEVILIPIQQVKAKILAGEICVAGSIAAIFMGLDYLSKNT